METECVILFPRVEFADERNGAGSPFIEHDTRASAEKIELVASQ